ncbi:FeoA family protein [Oxalicibacterium faecigallinarum]|uniref:FeoA family protein n=1 Tax=Oxalicibacterium faecigallinarum TaxID=573741 RepID=UPI00280A6BD3|nr:FeoA family protein [Oxalicibacterium faecigallinarum]
MLSQCGAHTLYLLVAYVQRATNSKCAYNDDVNSFYLYLNIVNLSELSPFTPAIVDAVSGLDSNDPIAKRLRELGFVEGEPVSIVARGPFGADPVLVQIGYTRFALRRTEAQRVSIHLAS